MTNKRWIPYARQSIAPQDVESVVQVLNSTHLTQGPAIEDFETAVKAVCGARFAVAVNSATSALHIACMASGLGPGDRHWTTPNTFVASANCGLYCGSTADFVDIDPRTYNMSVSALEAKLKEAERTGRLPKVLIPVDFAGQGAEMKEIRALAKRYAITVIEDASHAIGGSYLGEKIGSGCFADMTVFSFHPVKIVTSGEGGVIVTNDEALYNKLLRLRSHGITRDERLLTREPDGPWSYEQLELGYNYRITDLQAILGTAQLKRLGPFVERRKLLHARYTAGLEGLPLTRPYVMPGVDPAWHLYVVRLHLNEMKLSRKELYLKLKELGIGTNVHYIPVHLQPYYRALGFEPGQFPESESYYQEALSIPLFYELTDEEQSYVIDSLKSLLLG